MSTVFIRKIVCFVKHDQISFDFAPASAASYGAASRMTKKDSAASDDADQFDFVALAKGA